LLQKQGAAALPELSAKLQAIDPASVALVNAALQGMLEAD
jgi:hypothetical protein